MRCEGCGAESPLKSLFSRRQRFSGRGHNMLCPGCVSRRRENAFRNSFAIWLIAGIGSLLAAHGKGFRWPTNLLLLVVFEYISIIPHELAHAAAALLARMEVFQISFGTGRRWAHAIVGGTLIEARVIPVCGAVSSSSLDLRNWRFRRFLVVAAGPMANLALCAGAVLMGGGWPQIVQIDWSEHLAPWLMLAVANAILVLSSFRRRTGIRGVRSDGVQLFGLLFRPLTPVNQQRTNYMRAKAAALLAARSYQQLDALISQFRDELPPAELAKWRSVVDSELGDIDAARSRALQTLEQHPQPGLDRAMWLNLIAWNDLVTGNSELLSEAERFSAEAHSLLPWSAAVQSTRGWALVECGNLEAGIPLLRQSLTGVVYKHDRATVLCTLAIAEIRRGRQSRAAQLIRKATQLDSQCALLDRARAQSA
jgi:hypothetical protein